MKKIIPLVFLLIGTGAGVGAGILLRPAPASEAVSDTGTEIKKEKQGEQSAQKNIVEPDHGETAENEYVKLSNQFVVPIVSNDKVVALVVLALSVEVPSGKTDSVLEREPKLRDSFLQVLFDHANMGGFEGNFTQAEVLGRLRMALKEVAQRDLGSEIVKEVLIVEIARQDY
ncbi:flagellar basal body-associated FliL family protein [Sulfitobacter sp. F26169L]|uniref:flagellar basal body-associated FliL family protein n=1 Tax=Sulfitobacter sp. F26169L TaxID=2996015 RepID=UPI002260A12E|nr:flagellar basal body-associated FliL family protein [Sulfitobacter sp. F26169L]MCX7565781.1 flagellar basal body-associated FliL family protein [Sulfitobacter sp. F26169L]